MNGERALASFAGWCAKELVNVDGRGEPRTASGPSRLISAVWNRVSRLGRDGEWRGSGRVVGAAHGRCDVSIAWPNADSSLNSALPNAAWVVSLESLVRRSGEA